MESVDNMSRDVLVVDDEEGYRDFFRYSLESAGYEVTAVGSGEAALEALARRDYAVVLLDGCLPGLSGLETLRALRCCRPAVPVMVLSVISESLELDALSLGAVGCAPKPTDPDELARLVDAAAGRRL